jgi:ABC-type multidrug transport system fused ATPase/permease subunit
MGIFKNFLLNKTIASIKSRMPAFVYKAIFKTLPLLLLSSAFELIGLMIVIPIISIVINPSIIQSNSVFHYLFTSFHFQSEIAFVFFIFHFVIVIFILKNIILFIAYKFQTTIAYDLAEKIAMNRYQSYLMKSHEFYAENNSAVLLRKVTDIPYTFISSIFIPVVGMITEIIILTIIVVILTIYNYMLFASIIAFSAPFFLLYKKLYKSRLKNASQTQNKQGDHIYKIGHQSFESHREIMLFNKVAFFKNSFQATLHAYTKSISFVNFLNLLSPKIVEMFALLCIYGIFLTGFLFNRNLSSLSEFLVVFSMSTYRIIPSLNKLVLFSNQIKWGSFVFEHFEGPTEDYDETLSSHPSSNEKLGFNMQIEIKDLWFKYKTQSSPVLKGLNITIRKGETVGIIGKSGSGKSTLLNILLRLFIEIQGEILVDNRKVDERNISSWYNLCSYVPQNTILIDGSVEENIAFGVYPESIDKQRLLYSIKNAQLEEFVQNLENGLKTHIGENGIKISGGQRQRIGIARALYHGGTILLFDEATSSLDNETEKILSENIRLLKEENYTIIIIAHRNSSLRSCDNIYQLQDGVFLPPISYTEMESL